MRGPIHVRVDEAAGVQRPSSIPGISVIGWSAYLMRPRVPKISSDQVDK